MNFRIFLLLFFALSLSLLGCDDSEDGNNNNEVIDDVPDSDENQEEVDQADEEELDVDHAEEVDEVEEEVDLEELAETDDDDLNEVAEVDEELSNPDVDSDIEEIEEVEDVDPVCGPGSIHGRVCSPNGADWLSDVEVSVTATDCDGITTVVQDFTDSNGFYTLEPVPAGMHTIEIKTGSYNTSVDNVLVTAGEQTDLTGSLTKTCLDRRAASIAVLTGTFDHVEEVLDHLGVTYQLYEGDSAANNPNSPRSGLDLLLDLNELLGYDIIFINCGMWQDTFNLYDDDQIQIMVQNLLTFVNSGGSLYVSDWAYFWAELAFPEIIDFYGDDETEGAARVGALADNVVADVVSDTFRNALNGAETITLLFNWPAWAVATEASLSSTVHILAPTIQLMGTATLEDVPLVISHKPTPTAGTVFFTSFHHEAQLTQQMEQVLRALVFQL